MAPGINRFYKKKAYLLALALIFLPATGGEAARKQKEPFFKDMGARWTVDKNGFARTSSLNPSVGVPLELAWKERVTRSIGATPSAAENFLFIGTRDRRLIVLDRDTGERIWRKSFKGGFGGSVLIQGGRLYFNTRAPEGKVICLDINSRKKHMEREIGPCNVSPILEQNQVFLFTQKGKVLCLNAQIGYRNWERKIEGTIEYAPVFLDPFLYVGTVEGNLYKLDSVTGLVVGRCNLGGLILGDLCSDGFDIFAALSKGEVLCLEQDSLKPRWQISPPGVRFFSGPVYDNGFLYLAGREGSLIKLESNSGSLVWKTTLEGPAVAAPSLAEKLLFTGTKSGSLAAFDTESGQRVWSTRIKEAVSSSPLIFKDYVYYCTDRGRVYAFHQK